MQESYRSEDWDHFFALAQIYRASWNTNEQTPVSLLEGVALLKHCQFEVLDSLLNEWKKEKTEWSPQISTLEALRNTDIHYKKNLKTENTQTLENYIQGTSLWPLQNPPDLKIADAEMLRVSVENRCK